MNILLSNDDGFDSPGILKVFHKLKSEGHNVTLVAPHRERSTVGHSLTLHKPLRIHEIEKNLYAVTGSPADCVYVATRKILSKKPDLMISGINRGANLGNDIFYSGTVAAARESYLFGINSVAVSLCIGFPEKTNTPPHWDTGVDFISHFVNHPIKQLKGHWFLNVNVPDIPKIKVQNILWARQGRRLYSDEITENHDPRGRPYYWIGGGPIGYDKNENSDCVEVANNCIAVTTLKVDTTDDTTQAEFAKTVNLNW